MKSTVPFLREEVIEPSLHAIDNPRADDTSRRVPPTGRKKKGGGE